MQITVQEALREGISAHRAGELQEAERFYSAILQAQPNHPDANHNKGVLFVSIERAQEALPFFKTALEANPKIAQYWISYIETLVRLKDIEGATAALKNARDRGAKGNAFDVMEKTIDDLQHENSRHQNNSNVRDEDTRNKEQLSAFAEENASTGITDEVASLFQDSSLRSHKSEETVSAVYNASAQSAKSDVETFDPPKHHLIELSELYAQKKLRHALEKSHELYIQYPSSADLLSIQGAILKDLGLLDLSFEAFKKVVSLRPSQANAYFNLGVISKALGELDAAISFFKQALEIEPTFAAAYNNIGNSLKEQGRYAEARTAYLNALDIEPSKATFHKNLSSITQYSDGHPHICKIKELLERKDLSDDDRSKLLFVSGKIEEDLGNFASAVDRYSEGGKIRQRLLAYDFSQDQLIFSKIKDTTQKIENERKNILNNSNTLTPIFILGMPRSGTTLIEQIISSHSEVTGGGELEFVGRFGLGLTLGSKPCSAENIREFRDKYLAELTKIADGRSYVTDKMPHNFRSLALLCCALPQAKIIHVKRTAEATCWSNFKHDFPSEGLGYSYSLRDTVKYYRLYQDLMAFWSQRYGNRIYHLDYDKLTENQEFETRNLMSHLGLDWQDTVLSPEKNTRAIRTASQQQVRQSVYTGSSQGWRKFEPFLDNVFDGLNFATNSQNDISDGESPVHDLKLSQALKLAEKKVKAGLTDEAKWIYREILAKFPKNQKAIKNLKKLSSNGTSPSKGAVEPPDILLRETVKLYNSNRLDEALELSQSLLKQYPNSVMLHNIQGAVFKGLGQLDNSVDAYKKVIALKPDSAEVYNNMGVTLKEQGKKELAVEAYASALSIKPKFPEAYNNVSDLLKTYSPEIERRHTLFSNDNQIKKLSQRLLFAKTNGEIIDNLAKGLALIDQDDCAFQTPLSQIYKRNSVNINCKRHKEVFDTSNIIPEFCFGCFKVQVEVPTLIDLIRVTSIFYKFSFSQDLTSKTIIELRPDIPGHYKGLIYCRGLQQAEEVRDLLNIELTKEFEQKVSAKIKRGCSEYPLLFPQYGKIEKDPEDMMQYPSEWRKLENEFDQKELNKPILRQQSSLSEYCLSDFYVIQKWIDYAKGLGDQTAAVFDDRPIVFRKVYETARMRINK